MTKSCGSFYQGGELNGDWKTRNSLFCSWPLAIPAWWYCNSYLMSLGTFSPCVFLGCTIKGLGQKVQAVGCTDYRLKPL